MKVDLSQLDLEGLIVDLDAPAGDAPTSRPELQQLVHVAHAKRVRGEAQTSSAGLMLEDVQIEDLHLHLMRLRLGSVLLEFHDASLSHAQVQLATGGPGLRLTVSARSLVSPRMRIELTDTVILGQGHFEGVTLRSEPGAGQIDADVARVRGLALDLGALPIRISELDCKPLSLQWGGPFRLSAHQPRLSAASIAVGQTQLEATDLRASQFDLSGGDIELRALQLHTLKVNHAFASSREPAAGEPRDESEAAAPAPESPTAGASEAAPDDEAEETVTPARSDVARILDGVSGHLHADVALEVSLPVLMSRGAVHKIRLAVQDGTIDFRRLEHGLSLLEDALLDFSVRSDSLVLEVGLPLLPTRGFGKPIVRWPLVDHELELARQNRIHLSTLLSPMGVKKKRAEPGEPAGDSRLKHLEVRSLDCELSLAHRDPTSLVPRATLDQLRLTGNLIHRPDGQTPETTIVGSAQRTSFDLQGLALAERELALDGCGIGAVRSIELSLSNAKPTRLVLELAAIDLEHLSWVRAKPE